jgi:hypothetical protein
MRTPPSRRYRAFCSSASSRSSARVASVVRTEILAPGKPAPGELAAKILWWCSRSTAPRWIALSQESPSSAARHTNSLATTGGYERPDTLGVCSVTARFNRRGPTTTSGAGISSEGHAERAYSTQVQACSPTIIEFDRRESVKMSKNTNQAGERPPAAAKRAGRAMVPSPPVPHAVPSTVAKPCSTGT